ncbi:apoptosis-inducing factor, mitochondrion-associated, C-term-domain-containing protein [Gamsiella multidivaricata]|uniref:apoptosis-inducing factor, mitochondrion-associated, C-term-domain-containing protein n=1 Tax=Gamsiella multidivaricata TaxID=101098 RepID=UPI00221EBDE1|nr:apoptosis-inducing factor, mitochondrion-associated, C-term-domain-containing protein [Gamsiella multidivaricata]KAG0364935.1 Apoptosis-inducing factor 1, mitochondrial [Gamsiella multidivaricata]KAI7815850.1 apoptosis-inducing factor, mitochondrion-associated, C-term-domain-containing protein [Gamsiella multidivaricata]
MIPLAFRATIRSTARLGQQRPLVAASAAGTAPRQALYSLRQTARAYASAPSATATHHTAHHPNSDAAWVIGSLLFFGPMIYKLTAPPPRKKTAEANHHHAATSSHKKEVKQDLTDDAEEEDQEVPAAKYEKDFYPYILIGGGTASFAAMEAIREKDPSAAILIIGNEDIGPYMRPPLSKEMWFNKSEETTEKLSFKDWQGKERNIVLQGKEKIEALDQEALDEIESAESGVKLLTGVTVSDLNVAEQTITLNSGKSLKYGKVLLATGGTPKTLPILKDAGEDKVTTYRSVEDFKKLHTLVKSSGKKIVIVGGGFLGSELAVAISHYGKDKDVKVTQVFPEDGNMGLVFPRYLSKWTTSQVEQEGVVVKANSRVASSKAVDGQVELTLENGEKILADHVVVAVGIEANVDLAKKAGLEIDEIRGGVAVNAELQARRNVYCAGDMTSFHDVTLGRRRVEHYDNAILGGRVAGQNMASDDLHKTYKHQSMFWSDLGPHIGYEAVGILDSKLSTVSIWTKKPTVAAAAASDDDGKKEESKAVTPSTKTTAAAGSEKEGKRERATATPLPAEAVKVEDKEKYNKGLVLYLKDKKIVGLLMWNNFGKVDDARKILGEVYDTEKVEALVKPFGIHED